MPPFHLLTILLVCLTISPATCPAAAPPSAVLPAFAAAPCSAKQRFAAQDESLRRTSGCAGRVGGVGQVRQLTPNLLADTIGSKVALASSLRSRFGGVGNDTVCFEFEPEHLGLTAMTAPATGVNHIQSVENKPTLWQLAFRHGTQEYNLSSTDVPCTSHTVEKLASGVGQANFAWSGDSNNWGLWQVDFPKCTGFLKSGEYDIAVPRRNWGKLFRRCSEKMTYKYPHGWSMPMQFFCAMKGTDAVYVAAHDPRAWDKVFTIDPGGEFYLRTHAENMAVAGSDHKDPFPVMLGVYSGGWMEGCKIYRKFAITTPWTSQGRLSQRMSVPQALKDVGLWMLVGNYIGSQDGTLEQKNKPLIDAQKYFDVPIAAHWYNWHTIPFDTHYPHYFPAKPGIAEQMRDLVSRGLVIMPYINGRIVDISNDDFDEYLPYCAKNQTDGHYVETYGNQVKQAPMCSYTEFWQDKVAQIVGRLGKDLGVNAVYIDQIAAAGPVLCFDKSHGHPLGGGGWWVDGYRRMLKKVQEIAHSGDGNMIITTECAAEPFMDGVDAFLTWIKPDDRSIPMITAVYSGYSIYFASPAWFEHGDRAWIMAQGRAFIWGSQNGWMGFELFEPQHAKKAAYLKSVGKYRVAAKKFLTFGELVDVVEPTNRIEMVTETWPDHGNNPRRATLPSVQGSVWKAEDGTLGIFLVNYLESDNTIEFAIDPNRYGLDPVSMRFTITRVSPEGNQIEATVPRGVIKRTEILGPWEIRTLEVGGE